MMNLSNDVVERIKLLEKKYTALGQDMISYLDGLLYADYLTYWDYIHLDTLLSLQNPKTPIDDEDIFIMYHQITELNFKLVIHAMKRLRRDGQPSLDLFKRQVARMNSYFEMLIGSFKIMIEGMDKEEFLRFRMSLLPASGFQSVQYRMIEIMSTDLHRLVHHTKRAETEATSMEQQYEQLYWKRGATELATGKKTLTLKQFEQKYSARLIQLAKEMQDHNLYQLYARLTPEEQQDEELKELLRGFDFSANVQWPLMHYRSAVRYLQREPKEIAATGGSNWQKYLPPKNQRIIFFPDIWSDEDLMNWGKKIQF